MVKHIGQQQHATTRHTSNWVLTIGCYIGQLHHILRDEITSPMLLFTDNRHLQATSVAIRDMQS